MNHKLLKTLIISVLSIIILSGCASSVMAQTEAQRVASNAAERAESKTAKKDARIEKLKAKAQKEIDRRITTLNNILTKMGEAKKLKEADRSAISAEIQIYITDLKSLLVKIQADTDLATLRIDVQSISKSYRVYRLIVPKVHIVVAADRILASGDKLTELALKLEEGINKFKSAGEDTSQLEAALVSMKEKIADAQTQAQTAKTTVISITPDQFNANPRVVNGARQSLKSARDSLHSARDFAQTIMVGLKLEKKEFKIENKNKSPKPATTSAGFKACTQEAKICPDGSAVGRTGPKCEFTACPAT